MICQQCFVVSCQGLTADQQMGCRVKDDRQERNAPGVLSVYNLPPLLNVIVTECVCGLP